MTTNRLSKPAAPAFEMNAAKAREWARRAAEHGNHDKAAAWSKYADELAAKEAEASWGKRADLA